MDMLLTEMLKIMPVGQVLGLGLLSVIVYIIRDVRSEFVKLNANVGDIKTWAEFHDKQDNERFESNKEEHRDLRERLETIRKK